MYYVSKRDRVREEEKKKKEKNGAQLGERERERRTSEKVAGLYNKIN
jgi:hypothetical protein